jgi:hypothetical protein
LQVLVGNLLQIDANSITDQFNNGPTYNVAPSVLVPNTTWGGEIRYQPRSANNASSASGTATAGNATIPIGQTGTLRFRATLTPAGAGSIGQTLTPIADRQGVYSTLVFNGPSTSSETGMSIVAAPVAPTAINPNCSQVARPGSTTGGGFGGTSAQPANTGTVFNPATATVGGGLGVSTNGLLDNTDCTPPNNVLNGSACTVSLEGNGFTANKNGTVANGTCAVNFTASETPKVAGTYRSVTKVAGPNGDLFTAPANIQFNVVTVVTPRSGGITAAFLIVAGAGIVGATTYYITRHHRMKVD